jgi:hypothetical protein
MFLGSACGLLQYGKAYFWNPFTVFLRTKIDLYGSGQIGLNCLTGLILANSRQGDSFTPVFTLKGTEGGQHVFVPN